MKLLYVGEVLKILTQKFLTQTFYKFLAEIEFCFR